jgi:hypothetical protein
MVKGTDVVASAPTPMSAADATPLNAATVTAHDKIHNVRVNDCVR